MTLEEMDWNYRYRHSELFGVTPRRNSLLSQSEDLHRLFSYEYPYSGDKRLRQATPANEAELERRLQIAILETPELMAEARGWTSDAYPLDDSIDDYSDFFILAVIAKNYSGGLSEFYMHSRTLSPVISKRK